MAIIDDVTALVDDLDRERKQMARVCRALGLDEAARIGEVLDVIASLTGTPAITPELRRMSKRALVEAQSAGAKVSFDDVPADASCTVDGEAVVLVADDTKGGA